MIRRAATEIAAYVLLVGMVLFLAACTDERPAIVKPPVELTECADEPETPTIPAKDGTEATRDVRDLAVWQYVLALHGAYIDCKADVVGVKAWSDALGR